MPSVRVGRRGQLTLPKAIRQSLGLAEGDHVAFVSHNGEVVLRPVRQSLRDLRGSVPVSGTQNFEAVRDAAREARAARLSTPILPDIEPDRAKPDTSIGRAHDDAD